MELNDVAEGLPMPNASTHQRAAEIPLAVVRGSRTLREAWAEEFLERMTPVMSALSIIFVLVVLGEQFARPGSGPASGLLIASWILWTVFAAEFLARLVV